MSLSNFRCLCNFFFVFIIFRLTLPGRAFHFIILLSLMDSLPFCVSAWKFSNDLLYFSAVTVTVTLLWKRVSPIIANASQCIHIHWHSRIVSLHLLHFHICLGPGRKLALIKMYPRLLSHYKHVSPSHDASEHAHHTYIWSVISFNYFSRIGAHVTNQWRLFLSGDERIIFIHPSLLAFPFELSMGFFSKLAHTKLSPIDVFNLIKASIPLVFILVFYF